jgi:hypothetical protein
MQNSCLIRTQHSPSETDLLGLIESQLSQCKCIVKLRTISYSNGKQLVTWRTLANLGTGHMD